MKRRLQWLASATLSAVVTCALLVITAIVFFTLAPVLTSFRYAGF